jgi:hypothetical protein
VEERVDSVEEHNQRKTGGDHLEKGLAFLPRGLENTKVSDTERNYLFSIYFLNNL